MTVVALHDLDRPEWIGHPYNNMIAGLCLDLRDWLNYTVDSFQGGSRMGPERYKATHVGRQHIRVVESGPPD